MEPLIINPPGKINVAHLQPAVKNGALSGIGQSAVLVTIVCLAADSSQGWTANLSVNEVVRVRGAEIINVPDPSELRACVMQNIDGLVARDFITVNGDILTLTGKGITLVEARLSRDMRFPYGPRPRDSAALEHKLRELQPYEIWAIAQLVGACHEARVWKGFRISQLTKGDDLAGDVGYAYALVEARKLVRTSIESDELSGHYRVVHPTPGLVAMIYDE